MNKIIKSLSVVAFVAAIALSATAAYFSDEEVSTGNVFTAGQIDLQIDSECSYNGMKCVVDPDNSSRKVWAHVDDQGVIIPGTVTNLECNCDWELTDLTTERFFDFEDIKPGDWGENTISFHGFSNDAHLYTTILAISDRDVTCVEPEVTAETINGTDCIEDGLTGDEGSGELDENIYFFIWEDNADDICGVTACDNVYSPQCDEEIITEGYANYASGLVGYEHYLGELPADTQSCIGVAWCVGTMTVDPATGDMTCDGEIVGNEAQTDTFVADVEFRIEQTRHNPI